MIDRSAYTLRLAVPSDAEAGARLHLDCWREAYTDLIAPTRLDALLDDPRSVDRGVAGTTDPDESEVAGLHG